MKKELTIKCIFEEDQKGTGTCEIEIIDSLNIDIENEDELGFYTALVTQTMMRNLAMQYPGGFEKALEQLVSDSMALKI